MDSPHSKVVSVRPGLKGLADRHEELHALVGHFAIGFLLAGHGRPPLLLHVLRLLPRARLLQAFELLGLLAVQLELDHAHGSQALGHRFFFARLGHLLGRAAGDPAPPREADNHREHHRRHDRPEHRRLRGSRRAPALSNSRLGLYHDRLLLVPPSGTAGPRARGPRRLPFTPYILYYTSTVYLLILYRE